MDKLDKKIRELKTEDNKRLIFLAIRMNESIYNEFVFEKGLMWIRNNISLNDEEIVYVVAKCPLFWSWWRNQWNLRDEQFIFETSLRKQSLPFDMDATIVAVELYNEIHDLRNIKISPNRFVITEISQALREFTKQETERLKQLLNGTKTT